MIRELHYLHERVLEALQQNAEAAERLLDLYSVSRSCKTGSPRFSHKETK